MSEPLWLDRDAVIALHAESLAEFGGAPGLRDAGLLKSALARPQNRFAYEGVPARPARRSSPLAARPCATALSYRAAPKIGCSTRSPTRMPSRSAVPAASSSVARTGPRLSIGARL